MIRQCGAGMMEEAGPWAALVLSLLLLPGLSCRSAGPPAPGAVIDLLKLCRPQVPAADSLPRAKHPGWDFSGGLPDGWSAGPPGVSVHLEDDGLRLEHPDQLPWLELRCGGPGGDPRLASGIDPLHHGRLNVRIFPRGAEQAALYYSFVDPGRYQRNLRSRVKYGPPGRRPVRGFDLPGADGFETPIRVLRLYPALTGGSAVVSRAALEPREPEFLANRVLGQGWVALGQHYRRCWRLVGPGVREAALRLPAAPAGLRFAAGRLTGVKPFRLTVELLDASGAAHHLAGADAGRTGGGWQEYSADLTAWAGQQVTLRFRMAGDDPGTVTLIGSPTVVPAAAGATPRRPNVLLILVDTLRADRLSMYGGAERTSPHLDRLARQGVLFSNAFAPSSWTLPSVAALLTGRFPVDLGIGADPGAGLDRNVPTLAEGFSRAGYDTAGFSANFILDPLKGYARGFDLFYLAPYKDFTQPAGELNRRALDWLSRRGRQPFFCYLHYMDPHNPYAPPGSERHRVSNARTFHPRHVGGYREGNINPLLMGNEIFDQADRADEVARFYDDEIRYVDRQIGRLLATLSRQGLPGETVVAVVADHGEELHDRGFWSHGLTLYQEQLHVPLVLRLPRGQPRQLVHAPVSLVDLLPTLFQLAGLEPAGEPAAGRSLLQAPAERELISETWAGGLPPRYCLRQGPYKYVLFNRGALHGKVPRRNPARWVWENGPAAEELYHLEDDPGERHNLVEELPDVAQRMRRELERRFGAAAAGGKEKKMDQKTRERLRALGYIE